MSTENTLIELDKGLRNSPVRRHFERILCPIDLSPDSDQALCYAIALAQAYSAKLFVCHCAEELPPGGYGNPKEILEGSIGLHPCFANLTKLDWYGIIAKGNAADMILREVAQQRVDLIVMHSRRRPYRAALLGSTAELICSTAPCPVLIIHSGEREWVNFETGAIELKRVLIAHDFSDHSMLALSYALSLAQEYQSELDLLHVLQIRPGVAWYPASREELRQVALRLRQAVPTEAYLWCKIQLAVREGQPNREIIDYAKEHHIDLICMGEHGKGFDKWAPFGSNVDWVLRKAPCPILIARPFATK